jgi:hypothetical protein
MITQKMAKAVKATRTTSRVIWVVTAPLRTMGARWCRIAWCRKRQGLGLDLEMGCMGVISITETGEVEVKVNTIHQTCTTGVPKPLPGSCVIFSRAFTEGKAGAKPPLAGLVFWKVARSLASLVPLPLQAVQQQQEGGKVAATTWQDLGMDNTAFTWAMRPGRMNTPLPLPLPPPSVVEEGLLVVATAAELGVLPD